MAGPGPAGPGFAAVSGECCHTAVQTSQFGLDGAAPPHYMMALMTPSNPTFPAPDHDHDRCTADGLSHAERVCKLRAQKFTPIRRAVLRALLSSHRPLGAYEVIDELAKSMPRPAPITVYRALDFLMENGLVHRIESRNAFLACAHDHDAAAMVAFLICEAAVRSAKFRRRRSRRASTPPRAPPALRQNCRWSKSPAPARIASRPHNNTAASRTTRIHVFRTR